MNNAAKPPSKEETDKGTGLQSGFHNGDSSTIYSLLARTRQYGSGNIYTGYLLSNKQYAKQGLAMADKELVL